eukprot:5549284-Prymnesium_polylepis.1
MQRVGLPRTMPPSLAGVVDAAPVLRAAELLQFDALHTFLTHLLLHDVAAPLSVDKAVRNRDAFCAELYGALFDWIVQRLNRIGRPREQRGGRGGAGGGGGGGAGAGAGGGGAGAGAGGGDAGGSGAGAGGGAGAGAGGGGG